MQSDSDPSFWLHQALKHMSPIDTSPVSPRTEWVRDNHLLPAILFRKLWRRGSSSSMGLQEIRFGFDYLVSLMKGSAPLGRQKTRLQNLLGALPDRTLHCRVRLKPSPSIFQTAAPRLHGANPSLTPALASHSVSSHQAARCSCEPLYGEATNWSLRSTGQ